MFTHSWISYKCINIRDIILQTSDELINDTVNYVSSVNEIIGEIHWADCGFVCNFIYFFGGGGERNKQMEFTWQFVSPIKT